MKKKILIIDDVPVIALNIKEILETKGYEVCGIGMSAEEAVTLTEKHCPDLIFMDIILSGERDGISAIEEIKKKYDGSIVYLTAYSDEKILQRAKKTEPHGYITKPINEQELFAVVEIALYKHEMERKLKKNEQRLLKAQHVAEMGFLDWDLKSNYIYLSDEVYNIYGLEKKEELKTPDLIAKVVHPDDMELVRKNLDLAINGDKNYDIDYRIIRADGETIWVHAQAELTYDADGTPIKLLGTVVNITERKQSLEALSDANELNKYIIDHAGFGMSLYSSDGQCVFANDLVGNLVGATKEQVLEQNFRKIESWKTSGILLLAEEVLSTGVGKSEEFHLVSSFRKEVWLDVNISSFTSGNETYLLLSLLDITDRKKAQENLQLEQKRTQHYLDIAGVMLVALDIEQKVTLINNKGCEILGYPQKEIIGQNWFNNFLPDENIKEVKHVFDQLISGKIKPVEYYENPILRKDGKKRIIAWHNSIHYDQTGKIIGLFSSGEDITERKKAEDELHQYEHIVSTSSDMLALIDKKYKIIAANKAYTDAFKLTPDQLIGNTLPRMFGKKFFNNTMKPNIDRCLGGEEVNYQNWFDFPKPGRCYMDITYYPYYNKDNKIMGFVVNGRNITERKLIEEAAEKQKNFILKVTESLPHPLYIIDISDYSIVMANTASGLKKMINEHDNISKKLTCHLLTHNKNKPCTEECHPCPMKEVKSTGKSVRVEHIHFDEDGNRKYVEVHAHPIFNNEGKITQMIEYNLDITERKLAEKKIKASLKEKETLLKEIHHRVKNNMQIISSLINLQASNLKGKIELAPFQETARRIKSMALVHEKLYHSDDVAEIDFREYIRILFSDISQSYYQKNCKIESITNVDYIILDLDKAVPCGLILNELVTNSYKHAFLDKKNGKISIEFKKDKKGNHILKISDNGIGLSEDFDMNKTDTLGMQLVDAFVKQLKGELKLGKGKGTEFNITFPVE